MIEDYTPGIDLTVPANLECSVISDLLHLPDVIDWRQGIYDLAEQAYRRIANAAAMHALGVEIFTGKDGEPRCAANERERDLAIEAALTMDIEAIGAKTHLDKARRDLQEAKNHFEAVQLVARMISRGNGR